MIPISFVSDIIDLDLKKKSLSQQVDILYLYKEYYILRILHYFVQIGLNECLVLKGGTGLSLFHGSGRYSEDIDCDLSNRKNALVSVQGKLRNLGKINKNGFGFFFDEITDSKSKGSFRFPYSCNKGYESVTFDFRFVDIIEGEEKTITRTSLLYDLPEFSFPCHLDRNILCSKLIALGGREKGRDLYDLNYLIKSGYKLNLEFFDRLFTTQTKSSQENNVFFPVQTLNEVKIQLLERINDLYSNNNLLLDINEFLPVTHKVVSIDEFFMEVEDAVKTQFDEFDEFVNFDSFESSIYFDDILLQEDSPRRIEIINFLKNWSSREESSQIKSLKNGDKLQVIRNKNANYVIIDNKTGKIKKSLKLKTNLIDYLYSEYSTYFK